MPELINPGKIPILTCVARFILPVGFVGLSGIGFFAAYAPLAAVVWLTRQLRGRSAREKGALVIELEEHEPLLPAGKTSRDTLLLVHGFPDSPGMWNATVDALRSAGYRCLVAALPGSRGERVPAAYTPTEQAEALHAALLRRKLGAVTLLTHDWGSAFGFILAQAHPESVRRMVSVDVRAAIVSSLAAFGRACGRSPMRLSALLQ